MFFICREVPANEKNMPFANLVQFRNFTTEAQRGIAAAKSEARNPKFETNSNDQNLNDLNKLEKSYAKIFTEFQEIER
jgi:hypothetical protein